MDVGTMHVHSLVIKYVRQGHKEEKRRKRTKKEGRENKRKEKIDKEKGGRDGKTRGSTTSRRCMWDVAIKFHAFLI
jgi:hypothetical protein